MNGLYRGNYIVAVYDDNNDLIDVGCYPSELNTIWKNGSSANSYISRVFNGKIKDKRIHFIDVTKRQDDIFAEEDELFLEYVMKNRNYAAGDIDRPTSKSEADRLGVSIRTYFRHKAKGTLYKLEKKLKVADK